jgi:hypothetical protein
LQILVGQLTEARTTFTNREGDVFDPTSVVVKIKDPTGAVTAYGSPTRVSEGIYYQDFTPAVSGTWWYRVEGLNGEGEAVAISEGPIEVEPGHFPA